MSDANPMTDERLAEINHCAATTPLVDAATAMFDLIAEVDRRGKEIATLKQDVDMYKTGFGIVASKPNQLGGSSDE